jgi:hypothetical protein
MSWALCTHIFGREEDAELHQEDVESEESYKHTISEPIGENLEEKNEIPTKTTPTKHPKILAASMSFGARSILQICLGATLRTCSNKMAVEGWVKVGAPPTSTSMQWVRQDKCFSIDFVQDQNTREFKIHASFGASDDDAKIYSAPILQMGRWSYISVVRKSEVVYISVNGSLITKGTITVTDRVTEVSNIVQVGSYIGRDRFFHGDMAHLRIWSDWKSQEELVKMKRWSSEDRFTRNLKLNLQYNIQKSDSNQKARLVNNVLPIVEEEHQRSLVSSGIGLKMTILPPMDEP